MRNLVVFAALSFLVLFPGVSRAGTPLEYGSHRELRLDEGQKNRVLTYARALLEREARGPAAARAPFPGLAKVMNPVIVSLFSAHGELLISKRVDDGKLSLPLKVAGCIREIKKSPEFLRARERYTQLKKRGKGERFPDFIHIMVVSYTGLFPNFGIRGIFDYRVYEPQVTGLVFRWRGRRVELTPLDALVNNLGPKGATRHLATELGIGHEDLVSLNDLSVEIYRVIHFGEAYPHREFTNYHRGHKVFTADEVSYDELMKRLTWIARWYKNNVLRGQVTYEYYPSLGIKVEKTRSMTRSVMAVWVLNRLACFLGDPELKALGKETIDFYLERYFNIAESKKRGKLIPSKTPLARGDTAKQKWSSAGFLVAAILARGELEKYSREVRLLMDWAMGFQKGSGIFWTDFGQNQYFQPGHMLLTVSSLYEKTRDKRYLKFFERSFRAYKRPLDDMMYLGNRLYAPYAPAWFTLPFAKMYELTGDERFRDMVFKINDRVVKWYGINAAHQVYYDYDGILAPIAGHWGNTSITAASLESLCAAAQVARLSHDMDRYTRYTEVIPRTAAYLMRLQYLPVNTYYIQFRDRVIGGFKTSLIDNKSWMDNVWHLTNTFMKIYNKRLLDPR